MLIKQDIGTVHIRPFHELAGEQGRLQKIQRRAGCDGARRNCGSKLLLSL